MSGDPIKAKTFPDGSVVWWFRVSAGTHPVTGKRVQVYKSFPTKREAKAEYGKVLNDLGEKRFVARDGITVNAYLDTWEPAHGRDLEDGSRAVLRHELRPVRERLGERKLQSVTRADMDGLVDWMLTCGPGRGAASLVPGSPRGACSARSGGVRRRLTTR